YRDGSHREVAVTISAASLGTERRRVKASESEPADDAQVRRRRRRRAAHPGGEAGLCIEGADGAGGKRRVVGHVLVAKLRWNLVDAAADVRDGPAGDFRADRRPG